MKQNTNWKADNEAYWSQRADSYSEVNQRELKDGNAERWLAEIQQHIPAGDKDQIRVLDMGTGPGFFAIILTQAGYKVTAVDYTQEMLNEAAQNAGELADKIDFIRMDAMNLEFDDNSFDVIVTRNLTWNLPDPEKAYGEWCRVLKKGGVLLNFDANWYRYLFDEDAKDAYEKDRQVSAQAGVSDDNVGENFDRMEELAKDAPLSNVKRPDWDRAVLEKNSMLVSIDTEVWSRVLSEAEKLNYASTPIFEIKAVKI